MSPKECGSSIQDKNTLNQQLLYNTVPSITKYMGSGIKRDVGMHPLNITLHDCSRKFCYPFVMYSSVDLEILVLKGRILLPGEQQ